MEAGAAERARLVALEDPVDVKSSSRSNLPRNPRIRSTFSASGFGSSSAHGIHGRSASRLESTASFIVAASAGLPAAEHQPLGLDPVGGVTPAQTCEKKNCRQAGHQSSARETIVRASTISTSGRCAVLLGVVGVASSTRISQGCPGSYGVDGLEVGERARVALLDQLAGAARRLVARAEAAERGLHRTVVSPSPSSARPSRQAAWSPVTSTTGQPHVPHSAALMPVSPTSTPLNVTLRQLGAGDGVVHQAVGRAGHRVHADEQRGVAAVLEEPVYSVHSLLDDELDARVELLGDQRVERPALAGAVAVHDHDLGRAAA